MLILKKMVLFYIKVAKFSRAHVKESLVPQSIQLNKELINLVKICNELFSEGRFREKIIHPSGNTVIVLYNLILSPRFSTHTHIL